MKAAAFIADDLLNPAISHSEEPSDASCPRLFKTKSYFDYLYAPGNEYQSARFQAGFANSFDSAAAPGGFPWETLPAGAKIVDLGGGVGGACHDIMKKNSLLKFIVQDLPSVTDQAIAVSILTPTWIFKHVYS